jgi:dTDP-4-amino-4,6-dideoxygalactose transaminase
MDSPITLFPWDNISHSVDEPLLRILHSGEIRQGFQVDLFEEKIGEYIGNRQILTTCSGTAALQLALRAGKIGYVNGGTIKDEVITTPMTCVATNMPIFGAGAIPVFADIHADTGLINVDSVEKKITRFTKAIICVHWGGLPCDMVNLREIAKKYNLLLVEDAAHAFGATEIGTQNNIGNHSADITMFSFQALKQITCIDGGALSIADPGIYRLAKLARWYGIDRDRAPIDSRHEEDIEEWGLKWHMNDVNATIGIEQIKFASFILDSQRHNASTISSNIDHDRFRPAFKKQALAHSSFWLFTILLRDQEDRLKFIKYMREKNIRVSQIHTRNDHQKVFAPFNRGSLPGVDSFFERMICIPVHYKLTPNDIDRITDALEGFNKETS